MKLLILSFLMILQTHSSPLRVALWRLASFPFLIFYMISKTVKFLRSRSILSLIFCISSLVMFISISSRVYYWVVMPLSSFLILKSSNILLSSSFSGISWEPLTNSVCILFNLRSSLISLGSSTLKLVVNIYTWLPSKLIMNGNTSDISWIKNRPIAFVLSLS